MNIENMGVVINPGRRIKFKKFEKKVSPFQNTYQKSHNDDRTCKLSLGSAQSLGARGGVLGQYIANTSQGNGQSTKPIRTQHTPSSFRIFQAKFPAIFPVQEMVSTFSVPDHVTWISSLGKPWECLKFSQRM